VFKHGGFIESITDFDYDSDDPYTILAAANDNQLQIFRPSMRLIVPQLFADKNTDTRMDDVEE